DCHSPSKLGREANVFDTDLDFFSIREALKRPEQGGFKGTIEFFPEEGKYHLDGHRKCNVCLEPEETRRLKSVCPVCGRGLTVGVMYRVMELADRKSPKYPKGDPAFKYLIPLPEVLGEILGRGPATKGVLAEYSRVISLFGSEFDLLLETPVEEINTRYSTLLGEAVSRIRAKRVIKKPGFDGEFGVIHVFDKGELDALTGQLSLFSGLKPRNKKKKKSPPPRLPFEKEETAQGASTSAARSLNPEQKKAVTSGSDRIIVSAGPGTGKTFTLIARLAYLLLADNAEPDKFTAITFTNKAAEEVRTRLSDEVGEKSADVFVGTFHSFCLKWFRKDDPDLIVIGDDNRDLLFKRLFPEMDQTSRNDLKARISNHFFHFTTGSLVDNQVLTEIRIYLDELDRIKGIDLDSIIPLFVKRLSRDAAFQQNVASSVKYLFVDEFQDLNKSQYELVDMLSKHAKVFAIGDPDQAIYGFRGSDLNFFYNFSKSLPESTKSLSLTRNYRSAPIIIKAATAVIRNNNRTGRKLLKPQCSTEGRIEYYSAATSKAEAEFVVRRIEEVLGGISHFSMESGRGGSVSSGEEKSFRDIAVLYRLSSQASDLSEALMRRGIPFQLVGATPFFMKQGVRPAAYLARAAADPGAIQEHLGLLKQIRGIGPTTLDTLERELELGSPDFFSSAEKTFLPPGMDKKIGHVKKHVQIFKEITAKEGLSQALLKSFDFLAIDPGLPESTRLVELSGAFGSDLAAFSNHLKQNAFATIYDDRAESVSLMTLHAAKGLEFPVVFICGVEKGLIPCDSGQREYDLEEERRLFYVGITRAMERLILTSAATRTIFGKSLNRTESRFLKEIPSSLLTKAAGKSRKRKKKGAVQMTLF
ncbi:MAG: UvrD-helicase domain-containing protein, partial [Desulfobulbaceae bacterium]|nr:UvrD-helicase domain-containing protein [Desulfobulbaceae bacterium]